MKTKLKAGAAVVLISAVMSVFAAEKPLAEARAQIGDAIADSKVMAETMKSLSAADQKAFLSEVNAAIAKMPGSAESKASVFIAVNRAALQNAAKGNMKALVAEIFAGVPAEALTVLNESFAKDLFNRTQPGNDKLTDEKFEQVAKDVVSEVGKRTEGMKVSDVKMAFAAIMFLRASNGKPADLSDKLVSLLPESSRDVAKSDWIPAALGINQEKSYDPILGAADAGRQPDVDVLIVTPPPQLLEGLLADLVEGTDLVDTAREIEKAGFQMFDDGSTIPALPEPHGYNGTSTGWRK